MVALENMFEAQQQVPPDLTVRLNAGRIFDGTTLTSIDPQDTETITAPSSNPRIDRVVIDQLTGTVSVVTGTEAASPEAPGIPSGKVSIAQIALETTTANIKSKDITDERVLNSLGVVAVTQESSRRNALINGDFAVAQKGQTFNSLTKPPNNDDKELTPEFERAVKKLLATPPKPHKAPKPNKDTNEKKD